MVFRRNTATKSSTPATPAITGTVGGADLEALVATVTANVLAALSPKGSPTPTETAKPSRKSSKVTSKPSAKPKAIKHDLVPKFGQCCADSVGVTKGTKVTSDLVATVAAALQRNHKDREWTALGGLKTAVRQTLRANGTMSKATLDTVWNTVKADFRK